MKPYRDLDAYDLMRDDELCPTVWDEDAPQRRIDLSPRRAAQPSGAPTRPISSRADDHEAPGGDISSSLSGARGPLQNEGHAPGMARDL
jgi:hypothetical protein